MGSLPVTTQVSAGGVVFREQDKQIEVALILVGPHLRWQLPKGTLNPGERVEDAAQREVREETGIQTRLYAFLGRIEFWFYANRDGSRMRFHKFVHFYLMGYTSGSVADHDHEVEEARFVEIAQAIEMLAFENEKAVVRKAREMILSGQLDSGGGTPTGGGTPLDGGTPAMPPL